MEQNMVMDIIISLVEGVKTNQCISSTFNEEELSLDQCGYLLSQILRHYQLKPSQCFVSEKAFALWSKISTDSIFKYTYRDKVKKDTHNIVFVDKYKGSEKYPKQTNCILSYGESFIFNSIFIDEHIVPINIIIKELIALQSLEYDSVKQVLDKLCVCKLLKGEERNIKNKSKRSNDYKEVLLNDYLEAGIKIKDFNYNECEKHIKKLQLKNENFETKDERKIMNITVKGNKGLRKKYFEEFTINNIQKVFRGKKGYAAINSQGQEIGIVFMGDDKRRNYGNCELCVYESFFNTYGQWHRFTVNGQKVRWEDLIQKLNLQGQIKLFIE